MKFLIIEDDFSVTENIMGLIINNFHNPEFTIVKGCSEAQSKIDSKVFDIITLDGNLEDGHGRTILNRMLPETKLKTIVYSGEMKFIFEAKNLGVSALFKGKSDSLVSEMKKIEYRIE